MREEGTYVSDGKGETVRLGAQQAITREVDAPNLKENPYRSLFLRRQSSNQGRGPGERKGG